MKASFEQRDLEAKNSASLRQRISRCSTVGSKETSTTRIPKSASFSDLQDKQLQDTSAFPSSNPLNQSTVTDPGVCLQVMIIKQNHLKIIRNH